MKLHLPSDTGVTLIENRFIDQYMPKANGEYVKLYLYLLRCASSGKDLSLSSIADVFEHTEKDVKRALSYWEKLHLLQLSYDNSGSILEIRFLQENKEQPDQAASPVAVDSTDSVSDSSGKKQLTRNQLKKLMQQDQIRQLLFIAEQYLARPLTSTEQHNLLYFHEELHFSIDLIIYLVEYCVSKGCTGTHYMEKVAYEWHASNITTVAQAKKSTDLFNKNYYTIFNSLGIRNRSPIQEEIDYMKRWLDEYAFGIEIILEACSRTIRQIHEPRFSYVDSILTSWHQANVHHLSDIRELDQKHAMKQQQLQETQKQRSQDPAKHTSNRFNNFPQRSYDWSALEQSILSAQNEADTMKEG